MSVYRMNTQAKSLPVAGCLTFTCQRSDVALTGRKSCLFNNQLDAHRMECFVSKSAGGSQDFCYHSAKGGWGGLKKKKKSPEGSSLPTEFPFFFLRFIYLLIIFGCVGAFL